jgi:diacylglycerol kinase family enzyme
MAQGVDVMLRIITGLGHGGERVLFLRGQRVTIETADPRPVQLDGEPCGETPFTAEIVPGAINVVVPK